MSLFPMSPEKKLKMPTPQMPFNSDSVSPRRSPARAACRHATRVPSVLACAGQGGMRGGHLHANQLLRVKLIIICQRWTVSGQHEQAMVAQGAGLLRGGDSSHAHEPYFVPLNPAHRGLECDSPCIPGTGAASSHDTDSLMTAPA